MCANLAVTIQGLLWQPETMYLVWMSGFCEHQEFEKVLAIVAIVLYD